MLRKEPMRAVGKRRREGTAGGGGGGGGGRWVGNKDVEMTGSIS